MREAVDVLMEAVPAHIDVERAAAARSSGVPGADEVHDLHVWTLTTGRYALSAHVVARNRASGDDAAARRDDRRAARASSSIEHMTIQIEHENRRRVEPVPCDDRRPITG